MRLIWNEDVNLLARKVLDFIPNDFLGRLLDVPVGTAVFTAEKSTIASLLPFLSCCLMS